MFEYTTSSTITTVYGYDNADELTQYTTSTLTMTFTYASDGCLATKSDGTDTWQYVWDYERRLKAFKKNGSTLVEYGYNPTGTRRYASDATVGVENYFWSMGHVLGDYNSSWSLTRSYVGGPRAGVLIGMVDRTADPNETYYFMKNRLGSTHNVVDSSGTVATRYDYDAWGHPRETHVSGNVSTRYLGGGDEYDSRLEAYHYRSGLSSPVLGRGLQPRSPRSQSTMYGVIGPYDPRENRWVGADEIVPWSPWPIPCFGGGDYGTGYCDGNLEECRARCDQSCGGMWQKAICYRCCQCYFKLCYTACFDPPLPASGPRYGPPPRCKNDRSPSECVKICSGKEDYDPPRSSLPLRCYEEIGGPGATITYRNVCQAKGNYGEWGETVGKFPLSLTFRFLGCKTCWYVGVQDCWWGNSFACMILINDHIFRREQCPTRHPKYAMGKTIWDKQQSGEFALPYFDHWRMINSCWWTHL